MNIENTIGTRPYKVQKLLFKSMKASNVEVKLVLLLYNRRKKWVF